MTNTLAYYENPQLTDKKKFSYQWSQDADVIGRPFERYTVVDPLDDEVEQAAVYGLGQRVSGVGRFVDLQGDHDHRPLLVRML